MTKIEEPLEKGWLRQVMRDVQTEVAKWPHQSSVPSAARDECAQMQPNLRIGSECAFRCDLTDPESMTQLTVLLREFGYCLVENAYEACGQLIENLVWRKGASAREGDRNITLQVFLDLGEGDEVIFATIRAGEIST